MYKKYFNSLIIFVFLFTTGLNAQESESWKIYDSKTVARIDITVDPSDLIWMYENVNSDSMHIADIHFKNENIDEEINNVGFRLRGNTSRNAEKKSFKISFNEFEDGRKFYGIDKLNLNGEHNDPSIIRSKFCWDLYQEIGMKSSRASYAEVYINGEYYGLYINVEHIDSDFIKKRFSNFSGNLWKCLYPADLNYLGSNQDAYKFVSEGRRAYDLKTNEEDDDYSKLAELINILNNRSISELPAALENIFDVSSFAKYMAVDFLTGNWDDYHSLMNNYYLYHDPIKKYFTFIPYDYDNNMGIDFFNIDWSDTNPYNINKVANGYRPLSERLLQIPEYKNLYSHFIDFYNSNVFDLDIVKSRIDNIKNLIRPYAIDDTFRTKDYGFSMNDFDLSYISSGYSNGHVKFGLKQFIDIKNNSTPLKLNFVDAKPIAYKINVSDITPNANDTVTVTASIYSHSQINEAVIEYFDEVTQQTETYQLNYVPVENTKIVEENDRWIGKIPPLGENAIGSFRIKLKNEKNLSESYPRMNPIDISTNSTNKFNLVINEIMADNDNVIQDEAGDYDDWIELYNSSDQVMNISGYYLSDKEDNLLKWRIPNSTTINPKSFLLVWCDEDSAQGPLHTNFKLSASGEFISLTSADGITVIDSISFGEQTTDISYSRIPDGSSNWNFSDPTPNASNQVVSVDEDVVPIMFDLTAYPNPFNPTTNIRFTIPSISPIANEINEVTLKIYDVLGNEITTLIREQKQPGTYEVIFDASNLSTGVYLSRLTFGKFSAVQKLLLIK